jgi:hypothetical protein
MSRYAQSGPGAAPERHQPMRRRDAGMPRYGLARLLTGVGLAAVMLLLGVVAKTGPVATFDLQVDRHIAAHDRTGALTALARAASTAATPETVGVGLVIVVLVVLLLMRRRLDVLGGMLCALAAGFIVTGLAALPALQPRVRRLGTGRGRHR